MDHANAGSCDAEADPTGAACAPPTTDREGAPHPFATVGTPAAPDAPPRESAPKVSVLMAAHNAAPYLRQSIDSILRQSFRDFELILVDDASTDATADIAASYDDSRLRLVASPRNLGAVQARNMGFALAQGDYLAIQDADDISHPTRLARQVEHLDRHSGDVLVATDIRQMHPGGEMILPRTGGPASPLLLDWMMHLGNPLGFSSVMMRMSALQRLPAFLREQRRYAEDYDLYVRLLAHGGLARLPCPLLIYRVHPQSCSAVNRDRMIEQTGHVLDELWPGGMLPDQDQAAAAALIARHVAAGIPAEGPDGLRTVRDLLFRLTDGFIARHPESTAAERDAVSLHAGKAWEYLVRASLRAGTVTWPAVPAFRAGSHSRLRSRDLIGAALQGMIPRRLVALLRPPPAPAPELEPLAVASGKPVSPPVLFVTVVLESAVADRERHGAEEGHLGAAFALRAQAIFDPYGVRPAYLLDGAMAGQHAACAALRNLHDAGGCGIGVWWEGGAGTDAAAIGALLEGVETGIGAAPSFAASDKVMALEHEAGLIEAVRHLVAVPVTTGVVVRMEAALNRIGSGGPGQSENALGGVTHRDDLARIVSLQPHLIASEPQIVLLRTLLARGDRRFFVRLHLRQGDPAGTLALDRLRRVCVWFFEDLGGLPGDARSLTADRRRLPRDAVAVQMA